MEDTIKIVVEVPKGSTAKFDLDRTTGFFELSKQMPAGFSFPFDFGYIPGTLGEDGDPLDVIVISSLSTFTGCQVQCRIIGAILGNQTERDGTTVRNDRFIGVPVISGVNDHIKKITDLPKGMLKEIETFIINYNIEAGKQFNILKRVGSNSAKKLIATALDHKEPFFRMELIIPQATSKGKLFPEKNYQVLTTELTQKFGGLTRYAASPGEGHWLHNGQQITQPVFVFELMLNEIDTNYWRKLKQKLEKQFHQQEILIWHHPIAKIH